MTHFSKRRTLILAAAFAPCANASTSYGIYGRDPLTLLSTLESVAGGRLGVSALDAAGVLLRYRSDERFPMCSTFKAMLAAAVLERSKHASGLMQQRVTYARRELLANSPVTEQHVDGGATVAELCAAAIQHSDNTAANLLLKMLGGPSAVTAFARSIGDNAFRLDRWETELNTAIPEDARDTSTPAAMARSLQRLALGDALTEDLRQQLQGWLRGSRTGVSRIRAGVPAAWTVGDKSGSGPYGTTNDIAVLWPPAGSPIVIAIYFTQYRKDARLRDDVVASAARIVANAFG